ncbi:unnamed protein product [Heterosigma akashiwo]
MAKVPKRFALDFDPPTVVLEYEKNGSLFHYKMKLKNLTPDTDTRNVAQKLIDRHLQFCKDRINTSQVERLVRKLVYALEEDLPSGGGGGGGMALDGDLNKVSEAELAQAKAMMSETFDKNFVGREDPSYIHDKRVDFGPPQEENDWDDDF